MVHYPRQLQVACQGLVLAVVPVGGGLLGQPGAVADHALHQVVRTMETRRSPVPAALHIAPADEASEPYPAQQQERLASSHSASTENHRRQAEFEPRYQPEHATAQGERFYGL